MVAALRRVEDLEAKLGESQATASKMTSHKAEAQVFDGTIGKRSDGGLALCVCVCVCVC